MTIRNPEIMTSKLELLLRLGHIQITQPVDDARVKLHAAFHHKLEPPPASEGDFWERISAYLESIYFVSIYLVSIYLVSIQPTANTAPSTTSSLIASSGRLAGPSITEPSAAKRLP
jgi:hypothetical protein